MQNIIFIIIIIIIIIILKEAFQTAISFVYCTVSNNPFTHVEEQSFFVFFSSFGFHARQKHMRSHSHLIHMSIPTPQIHTMHKKKEKVKLKYVCFRFISLSSSFKKKATTKTNSSHLTYN